MTDEQFQRFERLLEASQTRLAADLVASQTAWRADLDARQQAWRADLEARQDRQAADLAASHARQAADLEAWRADLDANQNRHAAALEASQAAWRADFDASQQRQAADQAAWRADEGARQQARDAALDARFATLATKGELDDGLRHTNAKIENLDGEVKGVADGLLRLSERVEKLETLPDRMDRVEIRLEAIEKHIRNGKPKRLAPKKRRRTKSRTKR